MITLSFNPTASNSFRNPCLLYTSSDRISGSGKRSPVLYQYIPCRIIAHNHWRIFIIQNRADDSILRNSNLFDRVVRMDFSFCTLFIHDIDVISAALCNRSCFSRNPDNRILDLIKMCIRDRYNSPLSDSVPGWYSILTKISNNVTMSKMQNASISFLFSFPSSPMHSAGSFST